MSIQTIGVLTSGGDSPGMNAAVRSVVRAADAHGVRAVGVRDGYRGLVEGDLRPLSPRGVSGILHMGGTILGTARSTAFMTPEGRVDALSRAEEAGIDAMVVIGGDGSMRGADAISREGGLPVVGVPGTIDNDLYGTDWTIGFDTAVNIALESIDRIRDTAASHGRLFFIEVMGRTSGWIALYSGLAGGATDVLVPETPTEIDAVRERILASFELGKRFCLVVVAEGDDAGGAFALGERIVEGTKLDHRVSVLGHVQRGGPPTMRDRLLGAMLGDAAVTALLDGTDRVLMGEQHREVIATPLEETWTKRSSPPAHLVELMERLAR